MEVSTNSPYDLPNTEVLGPGPPGRRISLEIVVIVFILLASLGFLIWYLFFKSKTHHHSSGGDAPIPVPGNGTNYMTVKMAVPSSTNINNSDRLYYIVFDPTKVPCHGPAGCSWRTSPMRYLVYPSTTPGPGFSGHPYGEYQAVSEKSSQLPGNVFQLRNGDTLSFALINGNGGYPEWQGNGDSSGAGFYVSKSPMEPPAGAGTRFEFNWNATGNKLFFNISDVDGATTNLTAKYSVPDNAEFPAVSTKCVLGACPAEFISADRRCLPPKWQHDGITPSTNPLYGCPADSNECECRKFWTTDPKALRWRDYVNGKGNASSECQSYAWAYDEKIVKPNATTCTAATMIDNPVVPLRATDLSKNGVLSVVVTGVLG